MQSMCLIVLYFQWLTTSITLVFVLITLLLSNISKKVEYFLKSFFLSFLVRFTYFMPLKFWREVMGVYITVLTTLWLCGWNNFHNWKGVFPALEYCKIICMEDVITLVLINTDPKGKFKMKQIVPVFSWQRWILLRSDKPFHNF